MKGLSKVMTAEMDFSAHSKRVAEQFIQSVVAVDDELVFVPRAGNEGFSDEAEGSGLGVVDSNSTRHQEVPYPQSHKLFYQDLAVSFAQKGVVCSGIQPLLTLEGSLHSIFESSKNADITILDWQMDKLWGADGSLAIAAIQKIVKRDLVEGGRLRLITIYTAVVDLESIADSILKAMPEEYVCEQNGTCLSFDGVDGKLKHCSVEVIQKQVTEVELTEKVVDSFSKLTSGLLSNTALAAISDIRDKTHNILHKFNKDLDPAYLSHVIGLISQKDTRENAHDVALGYAIDLISEEIKSQIQMNSTIRELLSDELLGKWPGFINTDLENKKIILNFKNGKKDEAVSNDEMARLLLVKNSEEYVAVLESINIKENHFKNTSTDAIEVRVEGHGSDGLLELCAIECTHRSNISMSSMLPKLKRGTILRRHNGDCYVCIQPLCDSVRLGGRHSFILLKITCDHPKDKFTHVLKLRKGYLKVFIKEESKDVTNYFFQVNDEFGSVVAERGDCLNLKNKMIFKGYNESGSHVPTLFEWLGEFKQPIAQAISNRLAAVISRVGTDSFEWLRSRG